MKIEGFKKLIAVFSTTSPLLAALLVSTALTPAQAAPARKSTLSYSYNNNSDQVVSHLGSNNVGSYQRLPSNETPLEPVDFEINAYGEIFIDHLPKLNSRLGTSVAARGQTGEVVTFTANPKLQDFTTKLLTTVKSPHVAVVVMDPKTGKILSMAGRSSTLANPLAHAHFPAASLFKIVTSASAIENNHVAPSTPIRFRGGNYTLDKSNYFPDSKRDNRSMAFAEALGRSCNPVFARVGLRYSSPLLLRKYSKLFGFNTDLGFDVPLLDSMASIPENTYELTRTAAGFGNVKLSPIHAAVMMSMVANGGYLVKPKLVEHITNNDGRVVYQAPRKEILNKSLNAETTQILMEMLHSTTTIGTSRRDFNSDNWLKKSGIRVAGKTGTLSGKNPVGLNRWFVGAAPIEDPKVVVAVLVLNPGNYLSSPSRIGRQLIEQTLQLESN